MSTLNYGTKPDAKLRYEDTDKLVGLLRDMQAAGIAEAGAVPIVD